VRAGLGRERQAFVARPAQERQRVGRGVVDDVRARARLAREADEQADGLVLGLARPRAQEGLVGARVAVRSGRATRFERALDRPRKFGVGDERRAEPRQLPERGPQLFLGDVRELFDAGVDEEAFEADDALGVERREVFDVARHDAAPEGHVHAALARGGRELAAEVLDRGRRRPAVERHVDDGGRAPGRGRARRRREPLPLGAARLVDVHVRIDEPRHQDQLARLDHGAARGHLVERAHLRDAAPADVNGRGPDRIRRDDSVTPKDDIGQGHAAT
jgi:hypothetical protein